MPEGGTEDAQIIGPTVAAADDGLRSELMREARARREIVLVHVLNAVRGNSTLAEHIHQTVG